MDRIQLHILGYKRLFCRARHIERNRCRAEKISLLTVSKGTDQNLKVQAHDSKPCALLLLSELLDSAPHIPLAVTTVHTLKRLVWNTVLSLKMRNELSSSGSDTNISLALVKDTYL